MRKIAIRVDSSFLIGTGHVMRMLSLAQGLARTGRFDPLFIVRDLPGNITAKIYDNGFPVREMQAVRKKGHAPIENAEDIYADWLGVPSEQDIRQVNELLALENVDLLCVDHYAVDATWESRAAVDCSQIIVVDDLANRPHACGLLIDANLGRADQDYKNLVPFGARLCAGAEYSLLRPEFAALRPESLHRRENGQIRSVLVALGGVDLHNTTSLVVSELSKIWQPSMEMLKVVVGNRFSGMADLEPLIEQFPGNAELLIDIPDMATQMAESDLAIGGAGISAWERCCLGLPSLIIILAENQRDGAVALAEKGAALLVGEEHDIEQSLATCLANAGEGETLTDMSYAARQVTDGNGIHRIIEQIDLL
jgi:UDP-2,4-diacetamido-2,4,6-trideoxy-beta-L-altropyranose hydrolase